ncbi:MAG TPA: four helix bundle protein [Chryseosolibacter sp.]|nr:four helix bundle protein [Chryseosolibacter sp.]
MGSQSYKDLTVYKKAFEVAMKIFSISKNFPKDERYSLTDQIRRSSRSVCACIAEAYRKRLYQAYFISKCSDADMENTETQVWIEFASACNFLSDHEQDDLMFRSNEIGKLLGHMITTRENIYPQN